MDKFEAQLGKLSDQYKKNDDIAPKATIIADDKAPGVAIEEKKKEEFIAPVSELTEDVILGHLDSNESLYLKFLSKKLGREVSSLEELSRVEVKEIEKEPDLPEDVKKFWDYKKDTGRGFDDFLKANKDWSTESKQAVVMEYIRQTEQLDGDLLKDYYELNFVPDEDEATEREKRLATLNFEKFYKKALSHFKDQQKQYSVPGDLVSTQRQAEIEAQENAKRFMNGMTQAVESVKGVAIDDFSFNFDDGIKSSDRYKTVDGILQAYKKGDSFDYQALFKTLAAGERVEQIAKAYAEHFKNKHLEAELAKLSHKSDSSKPITPEGGLDGKSAVNEFRKMNLF